MVNDKPRIEARRRLAFVGALLAILCWRIATVRPADIWRDWVLILGLYALWGQYAAPPKPRPNVSAGVMAFLLGIYLFGALPHLLAVFLHPR